MLFMWNIFTIINRADNKLQKIEKSYWNRTCMCAHGWIAYEGLTIFVLACPYGIVKQKFGF